MKRSVHVFIFIFLTVFICHGQHENIVPVSPEAAALSKAVNFPVDLYTGVPDISIPLHEINAGGLTLPITLQYHAGGFKVNERHTRAGMGWNLSCDLQVTREINGLDDFGPGGYIGNTKMTSNPYPFFPGSPSNMNLYEVASGLVDAMPDKFYYKLLDKSGSFLVQKNASGTGYSFVPVPYENIRIEFSNTNFIITDSDGTKYYFGSGGVNGEGKELSGTPGNMRITGWKCVKIESSTGQVEFTFAYGNTVYSGYTKRDFIEYYTAYYYNREQFGQYYRSDLYPLAGQTSFTGQSYPLFRVSTPKYIESRATWSTPMLNVPYYDTGNDSFINTQMQYLVYGYPANTPQQDISMLNLQRITFRGGQVLFSGLEKLQSIEVRNEANQSVKSFWLYQSYKTPVNMNEAKKYNGNNFQGTLYLDSLGIGANGIRFETYKFMYHDKFCFGNHLTGHDAWKYPNLATREIASWDQSPFLPSFTRPETYYFSVFNVGDTIGGVPLTTPGSEWELASHEETMRKGVLRRVMYPTGGFVDFDFEANRYPVSLLYQGHSMYDPAFTSVFPQFCGGLRIRSISFFEPGSTSPVSQKYYKYGKHENGMGDLVYSPAIDASDDTYNLAPVVTSRFVANVRWPCVDYNPGMCSRRNQLELLSIERKELIYPASSLDYSHGNGIFVHYSDVAEYEMDHGVEAGKTTYSYYSPQEFFTDFREYHSHIQGTDIPYIKTGIYNGIRKNVSQYRFTPGGNYELARETWFEHEKFKREPKIQVAYADFNIVYQIQGTGVGPDDPLMLYDGNYPSPATPHIPPPDHGFDFIYGDYTIPVEKLLVKKTVENVHDITGNVTTTETTYQYDTRSRLSSSSFVNSKGEEVRKNFRYPYNFTGVYAEMTSRNIIDPVIEEQEHVNGVKVKTTRNNYKKVELQGKSYFAPSTIAITHGNAPEKVEVTFDEYDEHGNILQFTTSDGLPVSYLWGYRGLYPVAELKGVGQGQIPSSFKSNAGIITPVNDASLRTILANLRNSFPGNVQVSGYTHKYLTGVSSVTDATGKITFYEYDMYGRLARVKDHEGKTIQSHEYNIPAYRPHPMGTWSVSTPQLLTVTRECPSSLKQSYKVILPGGTGTAASVDVANRFARENFHDGQAEKSYSFLPECNDQRVKITISGIYDTWENPFFSNSAAVDFLQNGSVVYSTSVPFGDINDFENPYFPSVDIYIPPGTYQVSFRPHPGTRYANGNIPLYSWNIVNHGEYSHFESTPYRTVTFEQGTNYALSMIGLYAKKVTPVKYIP